MALRRWRRRPACSAKAPRKPASGPVPAWAWPRGRQPVGNRSDVDAIHIGAVAYRLATGWPVIRLEGACGRPGETEKVSYPANGVEASAGRVADEKPRFSRLKSKVQSPKTNAPASASGLCSPAGAVRDGVFFDVEANFRRGRLRWGRRRVQNLGEENLSRARWSQFATTSAFSSSLSPKVENNVDF